MGKILLLEDDIGLIDGLQYSLSKNGFQVDIACIFRKNCASVPEERSAIPLQTEQSSAG